MMLLTSGYVIQFEKWLTLFTAQSFLNEYDKRAICNNFIEYC